jgi:serine protease Do
MSSNVVSRVVDQLKEFGETRRGWLGVQIQDVDEDIANAVGLKSVRGALVSNVPDGPAKSAGILAGDVILNFDGAEVMDTRGLVRAVGNAAVGKAVNLQVFRNGSRRSMQVILGRREDAERKPGVPALAKPDIDDKEVMGMRLKTLNEEVRSELNLNADAQGVAVLTVEEGSDAYQKGIRSGDLITEIGQKVVGTPDDVDQALKAVRNAGRKSVLILLKREGELRFVALTLGQ